MFRPPEAKVEAFAAWPLAIHHPEYEQKQSTKRLCGALGAREGCLRFLDRHAQRNERFLHAVVHLGTCLEKAHAVLAGKIMALVKCHYSAPRQVAFVAHEQLRARPAWANA